MNDFKCPNCDAPVSFTTKMENRGITCKTCGCVYKRVYNKKWYEWLVYIFMIIGFLCIGLLGYLKLNSWIIIAITCIFVCNISWIPPRLSKMVVVDET